MERTAEEEKEEKEEVEDDGDDDDVRPAVDTLELDDENEEVEFTLSRKSLLEEVSLKSFDVLCLVGIGSFGYCSSYLCSRAFLLTCLLCCLQKGLSSEEEGHQQDLRNESYTEAACEEEQHLQPRYSGKEHPEERIAGPSLHCQPVLGVSDKGTVAHPLSLLPTHGQENLYLVSEFLSGGDLDRRLYSTFEVRKCSLCCQNSQDATAQVPRECGQVLWLTDCPRSGLSSFQRSNT